MQQVLSLVDRYISEQRTRFGIIAAVVVVAGFSQPLFANVLVSRACPNIPFEGSLLASSDAEIPNESAVQTSPGQIRESDIGSTYKDSRKPHPQFTYFAEGKHGRWGLVLYSPVRWIDSDGNEHEFEDATVGWKRWLDGFATKTVQAYSNMQETPQDVTAEVTLQNDKPTHGVVFSAESSETRDPITQIVETAAGLNSSVLAKVLPLEAQNAEVVLLKLRLFKADHAG